MSAEQSLKGDGALTGVRVIDLTRVLGGPYCTQILADHGADVIKLEPPQGDETRDWGPPFRDGESAYFQGVNRNKRSVGLDLAQEDGRQVLLRLLDDTDVLIENFKAGTLEKWGLGYSKVLEKKFPRLVHCCITGFGADGPLGAFPGYDAVVQAMSGMMSVNGSPESGPVRVGTPMVDMGTGLNAAIAVLMALYERDRSGRGQFLDVTLYDSAISLLHPQAPNWLMSGQAPVITGNAHPNVYPYDCFETSTKPVFLAIGNDRQFERLCSALGAPELADDPAFRSNADRSTNRADLKTRLDSLMAVTDGEELCNRLLRQGVPAGPIYAIPDVMTHPHTLHRAMRVGIDAYEATGIPIKLTRTPGAVRTPPPLYGNAARMVLAEAGFSETEIEDLLAKGVVLEERRTGS